MVEVSYFLFPLPRRAQGPMIVERGSERDRGRTEGVGRGGGEAAATRKLQSQFFARQILLPHSPKRFRGAASSITQNAFKLNIPAMCNGIETRFVKTRSRRQTSYDTLDAITSQPFSCSLYAISTRPCRHIGEMISFLALRKFPAYTWP